MHIARTFAVVAATFAVAVPATPAAASPETRLPDADLVCGRTTMTSQEWVALPSSGTLWVTTGDLAGHYVILSDAHFLVAGYLAAPPETFDGLDPVGSRDLGSKTGLEAGAISCTFVSRWGDEGGADTTSVVGPITMARVGP